jgi:hypothetical protein
MAAIDIAESNKSAKSGKIALAGSTLSSMISVVSKSVDIQLDDFAKRLVDALMQLSDVATDAKQASLTFNSSNLLKRNIYAYHFTATATVKRALQEEIELLENPTFATRNKYDDELTLVPYEDMDKKLLLSNMARPLEAKHAELLTATRMRIAHMLGRDEISSNQNPFRPEVIISALNDAWSEFNPDVDTHSLVLPLFKEDVFVDLGPVYAELNKAMAESGILPELADLYNIKKTTGGGPIKPKAEKLNQAALQQLRQILNPQAQAASTSTMSVAESFAGVPMIPGIAGVPGVPMIPGIPGVPAMQAMPGMQGGGQAMPASAGQFAASGADGSFPQIDAGMLGAAAAQAQGMMQVPVSSELLNFLSNLNASHSLYQASTAPLAAGAPMRSMLGNIKTAAPQGSLSRVDESTVDLMTKIFDVVFRDQNIPAEIKNLIGFLQVPVLRAALQDKEFFFKEEHPARRLIELLSKTGVGWDQSKGQDDPLYQAIKRNVDRVHHEFDEEAEIFSRVVSDFESFLDEEEQNTAKKLDAPVEQALKQERWGVATKAARHQISLRIGTGEVVAFVETFLQNKWVKVLTLAYSLQEEKPKALESAVKTMDDLIWSVKPKITPEERKELITKLPGMLALLNKWLDVVKLEDAERLQFFAELAECHASIVRAPLEMTPQRRLELAMEAAKEAAQRRLQKRTEQAAEAEEERLAIEHTERHIENIERGMWFEFDSKEGEDVKKVKLAWVSPMKSLFIFSSRDKTESFSMPADELAKVLEEGRARVIEIDGLINRALSEALGANDPVMEQPVAA